MGGRKTVAIGGTIVGSRVRLNAVPEVIDPASVQDIFVEGLASIESVGTECIRFTLYATRADEVGEAKVVVVRLVYPKSVAERINRQVRAALDGQLSMTFEPIVAGALPN
jgi:hypothetical protein